jgi:hypothetical protein
MQLNRQKVLRKDPMATAKELLFAYMDLIRNPEQAISLFAVDAAVEIPYLVEVGLPGQFKGHEEILGFLRQINALFPDVAFMNVQVFMESPDQVVSEYEVHCSAPSTQRQYHQLFFGRLVAEGGKIKLLREALNIISAAPMNGWTTNAIQIACRCA